MDAKRRKTLREVNWSWDPADNDRLTIRRDDFDALLADSEAKERVEALREWWKPAGDMPPCDCIDEYGHIHCTCGKPEDAQEMALWFAQGEMYRQFGHALGAYDEPLGRD